MLAMALWQAFGFCGDGDGQSGLGAYVMAITTYHWTINGNDHNSFPLSTYNCEREQTF